MTDENHRAGYPGYGEAAFQSWPRKTDDQGRFEKLLLIPPGGALTVDTTVAFRVTTPSVKCLTRVTLFIAIPQEKDTDPMLTDFTDQYAGGARLWLTSCARTFQGGRKPLPTRQVIARRGAGLLIPTDASLWGYQVIEQTLGDLLYGELTVNALEDGVSNAPDANCPWKVRVDYQALERLTDEEWARFVGEAGLTASAKRMA